MGDTDRDAELSAAAVSPGAARRLIRDGRYTGVTAGMAMGYVQGNLAILPADMALDFAVFCQRNPKPCPLIGVSERGSPAVPTLAHDFDLRTDLPRYRVWRRGELVDETTDIANLWRSDFVGFVLGCSYSFEQALLDAGLELRHLSEGKNVPMYVTGIQTVASGPFSGPMVVSMRPFKPADAIRAVEVTARYPLVHGAPVHLGDPAAIGIADIGRPDLAEPVTIRPGEIPVFWACGVTPQMAIQRARPEIAITHAPGHMVITDIPTRGAETVMPPLPPRG
ncbi:MAG: putative hydro-lyase [Alphaproteobacteria bacterium]